MRSKIVRVVGAFALVCAASAVTARPASAMPIFAQRYQLSCETCHTVLPELNAFGNYFRDHGYQLPMRRHGTTGVAMRYQLEYEQFPVNARRYTQGGIVLANADIGRISAFVHYNLGAGGGPSGLYLGYLATYNAHTSSLYRAGLFELPLAQSPGQRLDDLAPYGYYGVHVGLNDLSLASPRWGAQAERTVGATTLDAVADLGEFKGAAYGGAPIPTGETTSAAQPELALFVRTPVRPWLQLGGTLLAGSRHVVLTGGRAFDDAYRRDGLLARARSGKLEFQGEQWWGRDADADGFGTAIGSSGGYARLKYYVTPHAYLGLRYDASANPFVVRDVVYYGAFMITPHARFIMQEVHAVGGTSNLGAAITVAFPWPAKL